jgi:uncharacterized protein
MIPLQPILLSIPSFASVVVQRRRGASWREAFALVGWQGTSLAWTGWALLVTLLLGILGYFAFQLVPSQIMDHPNLSASEYAGLMLSLSTVLLILIREAIFVTLGEEIFFRGFLGGLLFRRFGFLIGNAVQSLVFLLPHLLLLTISIDLWPILPVQLLAGWQYGWLRYHSGSILPGWLSHTIINVLSVVALLGAGAI